MSGQTASVALRCTLLRHVSLVLSKLRGKPTGLKTSEIRAGHKERCDPVEGDNDRVGQHNPPVDGHAADAVDQLAEQEEVAHLHRRDREPVESQRHRCPHLIVERSVDQIRGKPDVGGTQQEGLCQVHVIDHVVQYAHGTDEAHDTKANKGIVNAELLLNEQPNVKANEEGDNNDGKKGRCRALRYIVSNSRRTHARYIRRN